MSFPFTKQGLKMAKLRARRAARAMDARSGDYSVPSIAFVEKHCVGGSREGTIWTMCTRKKCSPRARNLG
jgi:hypothetical protein